MTLGISLLPKSKKNNNWLVITTLNVYACSVRGVCYLAIGFSITEKPSLLPMFAAMLTAYSLQQCLMFPIDMKLYYINIT